MKKFKALKITSVILTTMVSYSHQASAIGLNGANVDFAVYCCSDPIESDRKSSLLNAVVGNSIEFPSVENSGVRIAAVDIDVSNTQIELNYTRSATFGAGGFNGYIFDFQSLKNFSKIKSISLNDESTVRSSAVDLSFDANTIRISLAGQRVTSRSRILIDVLFEESQASQPVLQGNNPVLSGSNLENNQCIAHYSVNNMLNIPCIAVPDPLGAITLYQANLGLWTSSVETIFKLWDVQQATNISMINNQCLATYNTEGLLHIPCVSVPSPFGKDLIYRVNMELVSFSSFSSHYIFKLTTIDRIN